MQQEDLASLFSRQLNFSNPTPPPDESGQKQRQTLVIEKIHDPTPATFASTHYTHTHHVLPVRFQTPPEPAALNSYTREPSDATHSQPSDEELVQMLVQNWIDPALLSPAQVKLFRDADTDQRLRLLELWRISPPESGAYDLRQNQSLGVGSSLQHEEELSRSRDGGRIVDVQLASPLQEQAGMETAASPSEPVRPSSAPADSRPFAEPYMMSGYEMLARREYEMQAQAQATQPLQESRTYNQAVDPVFKGLSPNANLWQKEGTVQDMENAYGNFEAIREMENGVFHARNGLGMDEEMIL